MHLLYSGLIAMSQSRLYIINTVEKNMFLPKDLST